MPSRDTSFSGSSRLSLENTALRGGKSLTQPRCKLALKLPGSEWLNMSTLRQPCTDAYGSQKLSLVPSWEEKSSDLTQFTNQSLLISKHPLSCNPLLNSESTLTSTQSLRSKLSLSTTATDLTSSILTTKPALSSLSSNLSLPSKLATTSNSSICSIHPDNLDSSLTSVCVTTELSKLVLTPQSTLSSSTDTKNNYNPSKQNLVKSFPSDATLNPKSTLGGTQGESSAFESEGDKTSLESLPSLAEQARLYANVLSENVEISSSKQCQPALLVSMPKDTMHTVRQERTTLNSQQSETYLHQKKMALVSAACCSLVNGPKFSDSSDLTRAEIWSLCEEMAKLDPEFVLKVALYTRQELNIRSTANFMLAVSALLPACRPYLRRYFCASVQLPSDWMEVPRLYQSLAGTIKMAPLPACLRRAMTIKFKEFSEYQLAKYNTRRQRGKSNHKKRDNRTLNVPRQVKVGKSLRFLESSLNALQQKFDTSPPPCCSKKTKDNVSLKSLIQRLHISKPANYVMSLLGCKYPKDLESFSRSGLEGPWQPQLAGCRMKLKQPETWERELSQKGNTGPVWEMLLDNNQVPFMALLRNLRSLIRAGIGDKYHKQVTSRLSNQNAVIKSRQFPFRFLSAYKVIQHLDLQRCKTETPFPSNKTLLERIIRREGKFDAQLRGRHFLRRHLRAFLAVPALYQMLKREKEAVRKARSLKLDKDVLQSYKKALEDAVQISAQHNIPPLPGRTVIFLCASDPMHEDCHGAKELSMPTEDTDIMDRCKNPTLLDVGLLLGLMVKGISESSQLVLYNEQSFFLDETSSSNLLQNFISLNDQVPEKLPCGINLSVENVKPPVNYLLELLSKRTKVDTFLVFAPSPLEEEFRTVMRHYRREVNADCLCVTVLPAGYKREDDIEECNDITLCGFTEQVLRFVSERGTARLIDHVEKVNERFNVPEDPDSARRKQVSAREIITMPAKQRWRSIRVFISSTFRDMHGERDILIGRVIPELRVRAARHFLSLEEVDLRWGITEEEAKKDRQLSLCLSEVSRSQIFIGILGERYGHTPSVYSVPLLPDFQWIQTYPPGRSITELEAMQFLNHCDRKISSYPKALFYLRDPGILRSVPKEWLSDFAPESQAAEIRVADLKNRVCKHPAAKSSRYDCQWGGERDGKPFVTGLEEFEAQVMEDIWQVIERDFIREETDSSGEDGEQEGFQEWQERLFCARKKLVLSTQNQIVEKTLSSASKGQVFLVCGEPSQGKTVFMAVLVKELRLAASSSVIYHFAGATPEARGVENMLTRVCKQLSLHLQRPNENIISYRALRDEFNYLLLLTSRSLRRNQTFTLLIDGADLLCGRAGDLSSDWIPEHLPTRVNLVLSMTEGSSLSGFLRRRKDTVLISLGSLEPSDRAELVRQRLAVYGKKLDESSFNNQMRLLLIKKGTKDPLYLTMACEELRTNAIFEKLSDDIQKLPASLAPLIQRRLQSLENEHGTTMVTIALTAICLSRKGMLERDLLRILSSLKNLHSVYATSWNKILTVATQAENLPMTTFTLLLRGLRSVLGLWTSDSRLHLPSGLIRDVVEKRYLAKSEVIRAVHLLIAAHLWTVCFPADPQSSPLPPAECLSELSHHLLCSRQLQILGELLLTLPFLQTHATLGLLPHLCQVYCRYVEAVSSNQDLKEFGGKQQDLHMVVSSVEELREFIQRSLPILSQNPSIFYQLALNEPCCSIVCVEAQKIMSARNDTDDQRLVLWINKPQSVNVCSSKSLEVPSSPSCAVLGSEGRMAVVGTSDGSLYIFDTQSGEDLKILQSGCDGVAACSFISSDTLCVTSYDGIMEIWNIKDGCRMYRTEAHRRQVTGCRATADRRQILTCSLDCQLKLWETSRGSHLGSTSFPSPLNCVEFHPREHVVAVGSWDGKITMVHLGTWKRNAIIGGGSSVRAISFSLEGNMVISGSLDGCVSLWAWEANVQLAHFSAHNGSTMTTSLLRQGENLLTGGEDGKVQVWSGGLGKLKGQVCMESTQSPALCLGISPNKQLLAVGYHSDSVFVYNVDSGEISEWGDRVSLCSFTDVAVRTLLWLSDSVLVTGSSDNLVRIWNVTPGASVCQLTLHGHQRPVQALAISSQLLASASDDVSVCLWTLENLLGVALPSAPVSVLRGHTAGVTCCSFSQDGRLLATGGKDRSVFCWDVSLSPPAIVHSLLSCHRDWVSDCAWTEDNKLVSCSGDGSLCLWNVTLQECLLQFAGHHSAISSAICVGERVLTSGRDGCLKVWNMSGVEIASIQAHHDQINQIIAYWDSEESQDDDNLVAYTAGSDGSVLKWSPLQMEKMQMLCGHGDTVIASASAPHGEVTVTAALDGSVRLWGKPSREKSVLPISHIGAVSAIAWSPDGKVVVSGEETGAVIVWKQYKPILTLQCSELSVFSLIFTTQRSFCVVSNDKKVSRWLLFPCKAGGFRSKKAYSVEMESQVVSANLTSSEQIELITVLGNRFLLETKTGVLKQGNYSESSSVQEARVPPPEELQPGTFINAKKSDIGVCDTAGGLWLPSKEVKDSKGKMTVKWEKIQMHNASISCLRAMDGYVVSASMDRSVKIWKRNPFKQIGMFHCEGAITCLSLCPKLESDSSPAIPQIACGDQYGNVYLLTCI
ncbi:telomerase component 1 [Pelobates cultripes]|uniref:Telomerase component 1 n=1 Tax=Pelobates cultripes TaxID=61616 RepID=A0AAD1W5Q9_PELCU|nr:telomerase component 1 [Pelobates cultripes]